MSRSRKSRQHSLNTERIWQHFNPDELRRVCMMNERAFADAFDMETVLIEKRYANNFYAFKDNGSKILAVAHLDTVVMPRDRLCNVVDTAAGKVVFSGALDDRLGAYIILDLLPKLGINVDVLLTVGEEQGNSTAAFFDAPKEYNWVIEFDRGGTDVVMYQFEDDDMCRLVEASGAKVGNGSFSDIAFLDQLKTKAFNWGVGYQDYHGPRSHAFLNDTFKMLSYFMRFHEQNAGVRLAHDGSGKRSWGRYGGGGYSWLDYGTGSKSSKGGGLLQGMGSHEHERGEQTLEEYFAERYGEDDEFAEKVNDIFESEGEAGIYALLGVEGARAISAGEPISTADIASLEIHHAPVDPPINGAWSRENEEDEEGHVA